jgi:hypothetical protein
LKSRGGEGIQALRDFAINGDKTYSFKRIAQFSRTRINLVNGWRKDLDLTTKIPGKMISDYLKKLILYEDPHTALFHLLLQQRFQLRSPRQLSPHPELFKTFHMQLLDCKDKTTIVCPMHGADLMYF